MKNLLHNIQILAMLALMVVGIQSCSDDLQETGDVEVSFTAMLPTDTRTRSFGKAEQVNTGKSSVSCPLKPSDSAPLC